MAVCAALSRGVCAGFLQKDRAVAGKTPTGGVFEERSYASAASRGSNVPANPIDLDKMKQRVTRLSVLQTGKLLGALYAMMSLVTLPFVLIAMSRSSGGAVMVLMLLLYPFLGFVAGVITAALYNFAAKWIGGIEVTVETVEGV
jgi:hypothetical protein